MTNNKFISGKKKEKSFRLSACQFDKSNVAYYQCELTIVGAWTTKIRNQEANVWQICCVLPFYSGSFFFFFWWITPGVDDGVWCCNVEIMKSENHSGWWKPRPSELSFLIVYAAAFYAFIIRQSLLLSRGGLSLSLLCIVYPYDDDDLILSLSMSNWFYFWNYKQLITSSSSVCVLDG